MATDRDEIRRERIEHPPHEETRADGLEPDAHADPITGEHGAHPVGVGLGAAAGGAALGGAAGAVGGPVGAGLGAVAGGIAGAYLGKELAEQIDPTVEEAHWREHYPKRDYYAEDVEVDEFLPAYQYGWESRARHRDRTWEEAEPELEREWLKRRGKSTLAWERARPATKDAWERVENVLPKAAYDEDRIRESQRRENAEREA